MQLLPKWVLTNKYPSIYDSESHTAIEMVAKLYGSMNQMIEEYNNFVDDINKTITEFIESTNKNKEEFEKCITQILEKYIKSIDMKIDEQDLKIDKAILYMKENIINTTINLVNQSISEGKIVVYESYDEATESLNLVVTGGV